MKNLVTYFWWAVTFLGTLVIYLVFFAVPSWRFVVIIASVEIICWGIKVFYKKDRPIPYPRTNLYSYIDANSFPSIHTARAAAVGIWLFGPLGLALAAVIGYSRIFLKKHYTIDVVAGAMIGALISTLMLCL